MEKKFTRVMVCEEFKSTCGKCPLHSSNNPKSLPCWFLGESDIQDIMKDYPYVDVKVKMIFNDIETRLTKLESYVKPEAIFDVEKMRVLGDDTGIFSGSYVDEKLYNKLEAKHEADCRLISEYDLEIKRLERVAKESEFHNNKLKEDLERWVKRYKELEYLYEKKNEESNNLEDRYRIHIADLKSKLFDLKNAENERDRYKRLYSFKCHDYNKLLKENSRLSESNDTATKENLEFEGENDALSTRNAYLEGKLEEKTLRIASLESKLRNQRANLTSLQEKYEDAVKMNKTREDVYYANINLQKTIEAKDREIGLLRAELNKYKTDDECDDRWID